MVLEGERPHAGLGGIDRDLDEVLGAVHEIGISVHVAIDGVLQEVVLDPGMDFQHLRVVLEHLIEIVLGVQLTHPLHGKHAPDEQLLGRSRIGSKITHAKNSPLNV